MRHSPRTLTLVVAGALLMALVAASAATGLARGDQDKASAAGLEAPKLKPVRAVVHNTTSKNPPRNVRFKGTPAGGITTGTYTATPGPDEHVIPGVPGYSWRDGCGPTAVGMVVGYYDLHGWPDLIPGDSSSNNADVQQAIASHGTPEAPGHYEDYSLPFETSSAVAPDKSEAPAGDEHTADSVADFMHTSWSADRLRYGFSYSSMVGPAFAGYVESKYPDSSSMVTAYSGENLTWEIVKREVDAGRPMVFLVDCSGDGVTDHFVTLVGYREVNGYAEYGFWDTWHTGLINWQRFRGVSSAYQWGVWGGFTLAIDGSEMPEPTPTPSPTPIIDTNAPVTIQSGADDAWHSSAVTVSFAATDDVSGVAYTEYSLDGSTWARGDSMTVSAPRKAGVVHTVAYRSVDNAGNAETTKSVQVKMDTARPVTTSNAGKKAHADSFTLLLTAYDLHAGVAATYVSLDRSPYQPVSTLVVTGAGRHTVRFYSVDYAGNAERVRNASVRIR